MNEQLETLIKTQQNVAATALFRYLFLLRTKRLPQHWELALGMAIYDGRFEIKGDISEICLRWIVDVAAEVHDALCCSEVVMVGDA